jgi:diguanylate cyclase (GGDEF)-like protein/PAS domain S-box-containing protein
MSKISAAVSDEWESEAKLKLAVSLLSATLDSTTDGILVVGLDGEIRRFNRRFFEIWKIPRELMVRADQSALLFAAGQLVDPISFITKVQQLYAQPELESSDVLEFKDGRTVERYSQPQWISGRAVGRVWSFRDVTERKRSEDRQRALYRISEAALSAANLHDLFRRIHEIVGELLPANNLYVALYDSSSNELTFPYFVDERDEAPAARQLGNGLTERVLRSAKPWLVSPDRPRASAEAGRLPVIGSKCLDWLGVPLIDKGFPIGVLAVQTYTGSTRYTVKDKDLLQFVSDQIAAAIARKQAEHALRESEERHRLLADNATDVIWTIDVAGNRTYVSPSIERLFGCSVKEALQQPARSDVMPNTSKAIAAHLASSEQAAWLELRFELEEQCTDGSMRWVEVRASRMANLAGETIGMLGITRDIAERKAQAARIEYLAFFDPLTGLANRSLIRDRLNHAIERARRHFRRIACLFLDLNRFKEINDSLGHAVGDRALVEIAHRLSATIQKEETLARLGGDEFVLVAEEIDEVSTAVLAERLLSVVQKPIVLGDTSFVVGASIGIAFFPDDGQTAEELFKNMDIAMYRAKSDGGGYRFYQPEMGTELQRRIAIATRLAAAVEAGKLELHFQPQVDLSTGHITGAEALLRWHDEEWGWVSPSEFIPIAEERGMMGSVGTWVMHAACAHLRAWQDRGCKFPGRLAVNLSAREIHTPDIAQKLTAIVRSAGLTPERFDLELTESRMMIDPESAVAVMQSLRAAGFSMSIDDFGTGHSSLSYVKRFAVDHIKIDSSFVRDMLEDQEDLAIVRAIIAMARSLHLKTVAEGVENKKQARVLLDLGCDCGQGYYFDQAQPGNVFRERWLRNGKT